MAEFQVGDRVEVIDGGGRLKNGFTGTVIRAPSDRYNYDCMEVEIDPECGMKGSTRIGSWYYWRFKLIDDEIPNVGSDVGDLLFG